ncbi:outer membrane beta-barrel protein [Marivirga sericea]|nr:outer membrane beta-barrel protein [Marivirga sericea]
MKISTSLIIAGLMLAGFQASAQSKFYISTETNFIYDLYQVTDEGNAAGPSNIRTLDFPGATLIAGYELNSVFSIESGIAIRPVKSGFSLHFKEGGSGIEGGGAYYHIPVRTRARIPLFGDWLFATGSIGANLSVTDPTRVGTNFNSDSGEGSATKNGNEIYSYTTQYTSWNKYFFTAAAEAGFDFKISPKFNIYSTFTYNRGFTNLKQTNIQYQYKNEPQRNASVLHEGSYLSVNIGLRFHFNSNEK